MATVTGKLLNLNSQAPAGATVSFALIYPQKDIPRLPGQNDLLPFVSPSATVGSDGTFSISIIGNDQIQPDGTTYDVTYSSGSQSIKANYTITGSSFDLTSQTPNGASGGQVIVTASITVSVTPEAPGNFQVAHGLGRVPTAGIIQMTSSGTIWFQSPLMYDGTNLYLVASDGGVTAKILVW